jgi:predicted phage tail protein
MAKDYYPEHDAYVATPLEALRLVEANRPGILSLWLKNGLFIATLNGVPINQKTMRTKLCEDDQIDFVPAIMGRDLGLILAIIALVLAVLSVAYAFSMSPEDDAFGDERRQQSPVNVSTEGVMNPVQYGEMRIGTRVVSSERIPEQPTGSPLKAGNYTYYGNIGKVVSPNSVETRVLHILGEGPQKGFGDTDNERKENILLNGTRLRSLSGDLSFPNVRYEYRTGTDPQAPLGLIDGSSSPTFTNTVLLYNVPITRTLSSGIDGVRILMRFDTMYQLKKGKTKLAQVLFKVAYREVGSPSYTEIDTYTFGGVYLAPQIVQFYTELDDTKQYQFQVTRLTPDADDENVKDPMALDSFIEVTKDRVSYDGSAALAIAYDETSFGGKNPKTEVINKGQLVRVPSNYNPVTRVYSGAWDGNYATELQYSNNPAWCIAEMIDNNRYGLGQRLSERYSLANLYVLGQFFDASVDDGAGGTEPRFTLNILIDTRQKALRALRDVMSVVRGQPYWDGSYLGFHIDRQLPVTRLISQANVVGGDFTYAGPSDQASNNEALVTFLDKNDDYNKSAVAYRDHDSIRKFGRNARTIDGVGTTSAGQALRYAKAQVLADGLGMSCVGFEDSADILPGEVAAVYDPIFMGKEFSGQVVSATVASIVVDRNIVIEGGKTYYLRVTHADGTVEEKQIVNAAGTYTTLTPSSAYSGAPAVDSRWGLTASDLDAQTYTIISIKPKGDGTYDIAGIEYSESRFALIDSGIAVDPAIPKTLPDQDYVAPPENLNTKLDAFQEPSGFYQEIVASWEKPSTRTDATSYDVSYRLDDGPLQNVMVDTNTTYSRIRIVTPGTYVVYVRARISPTVVSTYISDSIVVADTPPETVSRITGLQLVGLPGINVFSNKDAKFEWRLQSPTGGQEEFGEERFGADTGSVDSLFKDFIVYIRDSSTLAIINQYTNVQETKFTYDFDKNVEDGGPRRSFILGVVYRDKLGNASEEEYIPVVNPQLEAPTGLTVTALPGGYKVSFDAPVGTDFGGARVYHSDTSGFTPSDATLAADDNSTDILVPLSGGVLRYVRVSMYDTFGKDDLVYYTEQSVTSISAEDLDVSLTSVFSPNSPVANTLEWSAGVISINSTSLSGSNSVAAGSVAYSGTLQYVYNTLGTDDLSTTTNFLTAVGLGNTLIASYAGSTSLEIFAGSVRERPTYVADSLIFKANNPTANDLSWTASNIIVSLNGGSTEYAISSGSVSYVATTLYVYYIVGGSALSTTTTLATATGYDRQIVAVYAGGQDVTSSYGSVFDSTDLNLTMKFTPVPGTNTLTWAAGSAIYTYNDLPTVKSVSSGSILYTSPNSVYVYYIFGETALRTTTSVSVTFGKDRRVVAVYTGGSLLAVVYGQQAYDGGDILANTITASQIAANTITASQIAGGTITATEIAAGTITATEIATETITATELATDSVTAAKINVTDLAAVSATMGTLTISSALTMNTGGHIKGGQTTYNTGSGFFLGYDTDAYKFSIGDPDGKSLLWTGTDLTVNGEVIDTANILENAVTNTWIVSSSNTITKVSTAPSQTYEIIKTAYQQTGVVGSVKMTLSGYFTTSGANSGTVTMGLYARTTTGGGAPYGSYILQKGLTFNPGAGVTLALEEFAGVATGDYEIALLFSFSDSGDAASVYGSYVEALELRR